MQECNTTRYIFAQLAELGFVAKGTEKQLGLTVDWDSHPGQPAAQRIGIRADIDALPIQTQLTADYASGVPNVMHACGHDVHTTVAIGAMTILKRLRDEGVLTQPISIRGIWQPAEETSQGGPYMIEQGALEGVEAAVAVHVDPNLPVGQVSSRVGAFTAGCDMFELTFKGRSGHSARPYQAVDAIAAASSWIQQAYALVPRVYDCRDAAVISVGSFNAGVAANIVSDNAKLTGTIRTVSEPTRQAIFETLNDLGQAIENAHGCHVELKVIGYTPSLHNDEVVTLKAMDAARKLLGNDSVGVIPLPSMGAEDFAFFGQKVPCCMFRLGTSGLPKDGEREHSTPLHSPQFDIDERGLAIGAQLLASAALELSNIDIEKTNA